MLIIDLVFNLIFMHIYQNFRYFIQIITRYSLLYESLKINK